VRVNFSGSVPPSTKPHGGNFDFRNNFSCRISHYERPLDVSRAIRLEPQQGLTASWGSGFLKICHLSRFEKIMCNYSLTKCT